jgi:hypothetical protein
MVIGLVHGVEEATSLCSIDPSRDRIGRVVVEDIARREEALKEVDVLRLLEAGSDGSRTHR